MSSLFFSLNICFNVCCPLSSFLFFLCTALWNGLDIFFFKLKSSKLYDLHFFSRSWAISKSFFCWTNSANNVIWPEQNLQGGDLLSKSSCKRPQVQIFKLSSPTISDVVEILVHGSELKPKVEI